MAVGTLDTAQLQWHLHAKVLTVASARTLASLLDRIKRVTPDWVVIVRTLTDTDRIDYYAYRTRELTMRTWAADALHATLDETLELHEWQASAVARRRRIQGNSTFGRESPLAWRVIELDADGQVIAIGESRRVLGDGIGDRQRPRPEIRSGGGDVGFRDPGAAAKPTAAALESSLSAQAPGELAVGPQDELVEFRIEAAARAKPLAHSRSVKVSRDRPIVVALTVENTNLVVVGPTEQRIDPPTPEEPRVGFFTIRAKRPGPVRIAVIFRQAERELGSIMLMVEVVEDTPRTAPVSGRSDIAVVDPDDGGLITLRIEQRLDHATVYERRAADGTVTDRRIVDGNVYYQYTLDSEALGFEAVKLNSKPLCDRGGGVAATQLAYVERIYDRVTRELKSWDKLPDLQREARALGASLSDELFDPDVVRTLWPLRHRIRLVKVTSWEPFIPWEMLRLRNPETGEVDNRFLAEYGLIRTLSGDAPPRKLALRDWRYLAAEFPLLTHSPPGDLTYFTNTLPKQHGVAPTLVPPRPDNLYEALAEGSFDVLHLACHAESPHGAIDRSTLIIADEARAGTSEPRVIEVDSMTVKAEAHLRARRPLVFLNACETGRAGAVLTAWGGWPEIFLRAGAGAFVGTAWAVRDQPAAAFARAFYDALLGGSLLHEAATAARKAAQAAGDVSWLAFKVYGHPSAQRA